MKKVFITSDAYMPRIGGAEVLIFFLAKHLQALGNEISIFTLETGEYNLDKDFNVKRIPWNNKKNLFKIMKYLYSEIKRSDIVHTHFTTKTAFLTVIICRLLGKKSVVSLHGMGTIDLVGLSPYLNLQYKFLRYFSLAFSTRVLATSNVLADMAARHVNRDKIVVIPNGYDDAAYNDNVQKKADMAKKLEGYLTVGALRRLAPKNGIHYMLEAIPYIVKKIPNFKFVALGDGTMRPYLEQRIKELNIEKYVNLIGFIPNAKAAEYIKCFDCMIFPSTSESTSIACIEVMALGIPIVSSRVGGLIDLIGKNAERGEFVKLFDTEISTYDVKLTLEEWRYKDFADKIIYVLKNRNVEKTRLAKKFAQENFTWKVNAKKTNELYDYLLGDAR